jgi:hypothetical protein
MQRATLGHRAVGLERLRLARRSKSIEKLLPGLNGYLASMGALLGTEGIDDTLGAIGHHLHTYEIISRTPFQRAGCPSPQRAGVAMNAAGPDYGRVAAVLVRIGQRIVSESEEVEQEESDVDGGLLPGIDRGAGGGGLLDRRAS